MHRTKCSASPYIYYIELDSEIPILESDIESFVQDIKQGVAVYGYTPNIMISTDEPYDYWDSVKNLFLKMDTGKLGICTDQEVSGLVSNLLPLNSNVSIKSYGYSEKDECDNWLSK
ncbi:hypothetical protein [Simiduia aestuariiviva]|uniref:STAS/SEC14 domain-containing protein n=1 Tax=Simiduia aestuariiviva TaxID=1510459 RepID=A0A839UM60_9GAMM|nr:hypothetical protein [Simiduia aestuariiviva]MBB3166826.1 hypothetical protein [Simiduia aestuariiviva]